MKPDYTDEILITPENVCAVIVGMDDYPVMGDGYRLSNAVREAIEFARWLLEMGAGADRIRLFLSGGEDPQLLDRAGNIVAPQDPAGIRDAILAQPFNLASRDNLLFVYWAGHGATDKSQRQLLWDQRYDRDCNRLVFDLEDLRRALRSERWKAFPRQILLVNACANDPGGEFDKHPFNNLSLEGQLYRKQFTISAASPGEFARDGDARDPSKFFNVLLESLRDRQGRLRLEEVCERILKAAERWPQTPRLEWINWNGSRFIWSDDALAQLVYGKAAKCGVGFDEQRELYEKCVETAEPVRSVREIIARLNGEKNSGKNRRETTIYGPVLDFALHLIHCHKLEDLNRDLMEFFEREPGYERPQLLDARAKIAEEYRRPVGPLYLSIAPGEAGDTFAFFLHDGQRRRLAGDDKTIAADETLEMAFHRVVRDCESDLMDFPDNLHFHFFLRVEALSLALHEWKDPTRSGDEKLERRHRVALRSLERARGSDPGWGFAAGRWRRSAASLKGRSLSRLRINWFDPCAACDFADAADDHECVGFHAPPPADVLRKALEEGLPFLIWPRQNAAGWRDLVEQSEVHGHLDRAQEHFPRIRRKNPETPFAVLWDDPDCNPYADARQPAAPVHVPFTDIA